MPRIPTESVRQSFYTSKSSPVSTELTVQLTTKSVSVFEASKLILKIGGIREHHRPPAG